MLFALLPSMPVLCADPPPPRDATVVTAEFIAALAGEMRTNNFALRAAASRADAARENTASVRAWEDPMVMVGGLVADQEMSAEDGNIAYGVQQKLPLFGKARRAREMARSELGVELADADAQFQVFRSQLAKALFRAAYLGRVGDVGEEDLRWLDGALVSTTERYRVGEASQVYVLRLQNERARRADQLVTDRRRLQQQLATVNRLLNRNVTSSWPRLELPLPAGNVAFDESLASLAIGQEPKLKTLRARIRQAEAAVNVARRSSAPDISLGAEMWNYTGNGDFRQAVLTLSMNVPWVNAGKYRRDVARESARLQATEYDAFDYEQGVREEVFRLTVAIDSARREAILNQSEILPRSEQALATAQSLWASGRGMFLDVLEARLMLIEAKLMYARAVSEQYEMLSELVLCCGLGDLGALEMIGAAAKPSGPAEPAPKR
jgi:outer membrane protein TolC